MNDTMICDPYFLQNDVRYVPAIPGIFSRTIKSKISFIAVSWSGISMLIVGTYLNEASGDFSDIINSS